MNEKYYICKHCGNIVKLVNDKGIPVMCCGEKMAELIPGTSDGAVEKHVPIVKKDGNIVVVEVGSVAHPMIEEHFIQWIEIFTNKGSQFKALKPGDKPTAEFLLLDGEQLESVYAYCNLHGLWKANI